MKRALLASFIMVSFAHAQEWTSLGLQSASLTALAVSPSKPEILYAGGFGEIFRSSDGGESWDTVLTECSVTVLSIHPTNPDIVYAAGLFKDYSLLRKTSDGGKTWAKSDSGIAFGTLAAIEIDPSHPDTMYAGSATAIDIPGLYKSTNGGGTWNKILGSAFAIAVNPWNTEEVWVTRSPDVFRSTDGGTTWASTSPVPVRGIPYAIAFASPGTSVLVGAYWCCNFHDGLAITTDSGASWQAAINGLPDSSGVRDLLVVSGPAGDRFFIAAVGHVYQAGDDLNWEDITDNLPGAVGIAFGGEMLYAFSNDSGVYVRKILASAADQREIPRSAVLSQNYPNPFNPGTTVRYAIAEASKVRLAVFDMLGREVAVLVNERKDAGVHEIRFDGSGLASGLYLCRLMTGGSVQVRKLVLLK